MRHFGSELLDKHGRDAARHAHAEHYTELAVALAALAAGPEEDIALEQYELELANVRAAFERSLDADDIELAGRIAEVGQAARARTGSTSRRWPGRRRRVNRPRRGQQPVAVTLIAIRAYETYLRGDLRSGLAQIAEAEQLATEWALPDPAGRARDQSRPADPARSGGRRRRVRRAGG